MTRAFAPILAVLLVSTPGALSQSPVERGSYLVNTLMTCHNCHAPVGPNGPQFDRALSGGPRFNEAAFDVTASVQVHGGRSAPSFNVVYNGRPMVTEPLQR